MSIKLVPSEETKKTGIPCLPFLAKFTTSEGKYIIVVFSSKNKGAYQGIVLCSNWESFPAGRELTENVLDQNWEILKEPITLENEW